MNRRFALYAVLMFAALSLSIRAADDPVEIDPSDDTWLSSDYTGKAQKRGETDEMQIYGKADDTGNRGLIKFDGKKIAPGFKGAILRLTAWNFSYTSPKPAYFRCHAITNAWNQETATWDIRSGKLLWAHLGGDWDPKPASGYSFTGPIGGNRDIYFDLTDLAREWQANPGKNEGVMVMLEKGCTAEVRVRTKEFGTENNRPKLMLYYQKAPQKMAAIIPADQVPPYEPLDPAAPSVTMGSRPDTLKLNDAFETKFSASGAKEPYQFVNASQPIPGLALAPDGTLKGKPSKAGVFIFGVMCVASNGKKATHWDRWIVVDPNAAPKPPPAPAVAQNDKPKDAPKAAGADDKKPEDKKPKPAGGPQDE